MRKLQPYSGYEQIDFLIPTAYSGDCYARYYIRLSEMRESLSIINQCISKLSSNVLTNVAIGQTSKFKTKKSMEDLIKDFKEKSEGFKVRAGSVYMSIEAPKGETGVYLISDGSRKPYRCRIKAPGFLHLQGLNSISKNLLIADVVTNIGSLDIVFGEVDR